MATSTTFPATGREFRVLSLAGGGYLGLYTASVLARLEDEIGEPLGRRFDLIAGTSVGGVLALALAYEIPMEKLVRLFQRDGTKVFSPRALPSGAVTRLLDLTRAVIGPKYTGRALRDKLVDYFGRRTMAEALHHVVVPAVNVTRAQTKVFKTPHAPGSTGDEGVRAVDVAMATSAAPAYFPLVRIGDDLFADGGLFAVAPDQIALHEAEHFMGIDPLRVRMLSVGTATSGYRPEEGVTDDAGAVGWLADGRLILTLVSVQQQHVEAMMEDRLGKRYMRLDAQWAAGARLGIDVATTKAADTLIGLASRTLFEADRAALAPFIAERAKAARAE